MFRPSLVGARRSLSAIIILTCLLSASGAAAALAYHLPNEWPAPDPNALETVSRSLHLRIAEDEAGLLALNAELMQGDSPSGWDTYCIARNAHVALGHSRLAAVIADRDAAALAGLSEGTFALDDDSWLMIQAISQWLAERSGTAADIIAELVIRRPDWSPPLNSVLWSCLFSQLAPVAELQACLEAQADDGLALLLLVHDLVRRYGDDAEALDSLQVFVGKAPDLPETRLLAQVIAHQKSWSAAAPDEAGLRSQWQELVAAHGDLAYYAASTYAYEIATRLPASRAADLLLELGDDPLGRAFRLRRAESLINQGEELAASEALETVDASGAFPLALRYQITNRVADGDSLSGVLATIRRDVICVGNTLGVQFSYRTIGQDSLWGEVWAELSREWPEATISHRLRGLNQERLPDLLALRDSLRSLDLDPTVFDRSLAVLDAATAPEVDIAAIEAEPDPRQRQRRFELAQITAEYLGDHDLRERLNRAEIRTTDDPADIRTRARSGIINDEDELARLTLRRLAELQADPIANLEIRVLAVLALQGTEAARDTLRLVDVSTVTSIQHLSDIGNMANYLKLTEVLTRTAERLHEIAPEAFTTKMIAVADAEQRGDNPAAVTILRGLSAEYPGNQFLKQKLMEHGDSVVALDALPTETVDRANLFAVFGDDLDDLDAVRSRRVAEVDTFQSDVLTLLSRRSLVISGLDDSYDRNRIITQIITRAGADGWRSFVFQFDPSNGVPHVRTARVLTPDGKVLDTDPGEILVRAPEGSDSDVSDSREMVIPLRGVVPGAIIDVAYDLQNGSYLDNTWSMVEFFLGGAPTSEYIFELYTPTAHSLRTVVHGDITAVPPDSVTGVRRWIIRDLATARDEDSRPALSEIIPWVGLTTFADWDAVGRSYNPHFWRGIEDSPRIQALADSLADSGSKYEKAEALYRFVVAEISPLAVELNSGRLVPSSCNEVLDRGWGDCKDNSHLLVALLQAAGIDSRPVLVSTVGNFDPQDDFPSLLSFNHMIVQITGIKGKPYCDPLNGNACLDWLPAMSAGRRGLHLNRDGSSEFATVPPPRPEDHLSVLEVDVQPVGERTLRYTINGHFTGDIGSYMKQITAYADTNVTRRYLNISVGFGVPQGVPIASWSVTDADCGSIDIAMTYVDTVWAEEGASSAILHHANEGSIYWPLPPSEDRLYDVVFPSTYTARLKLRLHGNEFWTPDERIVPFKVENEFAHGTIKGKKGKEDGHRLLTIEHEYTLEARVIPRDNFEDFRRDAVAYAMFSSQRYDFRRVLDRDLLKDIESYAKKNPDDEGFRLRAAMNLLGSDLGGHGEEGEPRRVAAMDLLSPLIEGDSPNSLATILAARIHMKRGSYNLADSLLNKALVGQPDEMYLLSLSALANSELERWDVVAERARVLANKTGNALAVQQLAMALLRQGDEDGAADQFERMRLLGNPLSELDVVNLKFIVAESANDLASMKEMLPRLEELSDDPDQIDLVKCSIYSLERRTVETIPLLEALLSKSPASNLLCNNLAWSYAICGQNLERALMLSRVALLLEDDPSSSRNTYAAVLARLGKWKDAREIFRDLYENDDRPKERKVNGYFLGLAEVQLGHEDKAVEIWRSIVDLPASPKWSQHVRDSLKALEESGDVLASIFEG